MSSERGGRGDSRKSAANRARRGDSHEPAPEARRAGKRVAAPPIDAVDGARAALALGVAAGAIAIFRTATPFDPSMTWWGANSLRFVAPAFGWLLWMLVPVAFVPAIAKPVASRLEALGDGLARRGLAPQAAVAAVAMALVVGLADKVGVVGDFLLRLGCVRGQLPVHIVFPQALPFDLILHHHLPVNLTRAGLADPNAWERTLGALEAGALTLAAAAFARRLGLKGVAAAACVALIAFSGALSMFTGYGKGFVELTLITVLAAGFALRVIHDGRGAWPLALCLVAGVLFHRSALALFVPLAVVAWLWWRGIGAREPRGRFSTVAAFLAPPLAVLAFLPLIVASIRVTDAKHLAPGGSSPAAILGAAFAPAHVVDVLNLVLTGAPFLLAAPVLAWLLVKPLRARGREWAVLLAFALPALAILMFVHPRQGLFRDTDVFAPSLAALAVAAAALAGDALRAAGSRAWLAVPVVVVTLLVTVQTMALSIDTTRGLARVKAYLDGPPRRVDEERALTWTFLAERMLADHPDEAVVAFEHAAELAPSPRILTEWALAEEDRRNWSGAQRVYRMAIARAPNFTEVWLGLANVSMTLGDWKSAREAIGTATELEPQRPEVLKLQRRYEETAPRDSAR